MNLNQESEGKVSVLAELLSRHPALTICESGVVEAEALLESSFSNGHKLLICGNGGSAADSEHIVGELMKSFKFKRKIDSSFAAAYREACGVEAPAWLEGALPAISLVSHVALSTAFANDESAVGVFAQQVYGYGKQGDVLLAISTSGNSQNVVEAAKVAKAKNIRTIALTGAKDSKLSRLAEVSIRVPETEVFKVQEMHIVIYHYLCAAVESHFFRDAEG